MEFNFVRFEAKLDQRLAELRAELVKWMFVFWTGTTFTVLTQCSRSSDCNLSV